MGSTTFKKEKGDHRAVHIKVSWYRNRSCHIQVRSFIHIKRLSKMCMRGRHEEEWDEVRDRKATFSRVHASNGIQHSDCGVSGFRKWALHGKTPLRKQMVFHRFHDKQLALEVIAQEFIVLHLVHKKLINRKQNQKISEHQTTYGSISQPDAMAMLSVAGPQNARAIKTQCLLSKSCRTVLANSRPIGSFQVSYIFAIRVKAKYRTKFGLSFNNNYKHKVHFL